MTMKAFEEEVSEIPFFLKAAILVFVGLFLVIGLIGLILPIIPGILFLALAAWLMTKVSSRFAFHLENHPGWMRLKNYWRSISLLSVAQKVKLTVLLVVRSVVDGVANAIRFLRTK